MANPPPDDNPVNLTDPPPPPHVKLTDPPSPPHVESVTYPVDLVIDLNPPPADLDDTTLKKIKMSKANAVAVKNIEPTKERTLKI